MDSHLMTLGTWFYLEKLVHGALEGLGYRAEAVSNPGTERRNPVPVWQPVR